MSVDNLSSFTYRAAVVAYAPIRRLIRPALSRRFPLRFCVRETLCTSWIPTMRLVAILMTLLAVGFASRAQASELTAAFEAACERTPDIPALAARRAEIGAKANAAEALLPGGPWATVLYRDDELTNDRGLREFRAEFDVPVWLRGERGAALASALTEGERLEAEITYRRLQVAKRVRDSYWAVEDARARIAVAERRRASASRLAQSQKGQTAAGQTELIESKLATAEARDADAELAGLRAELEEALIAFRVLTGVEPPRKFRELEAAMPPLHPRIDLRRRATEKAAADEALAWTVDRERPSVGVFSWNVDAPGLEPNANTIGVHARIPFAYDGVNQPKRAAAAAEVVAAQEELALAEREIAGETAQMRVRLEGARRRLTALEARRADLASVVDLTQAAQEAGQTPLNDLIRARLQLYEADLARATARVAIERARSDVNHALGLEP